MITEFNYERAQQGDKEYQDYFLSENKGLVHLVVKKFVGRGYDIDDLIQLGMIGLYKAMMNFDESFGVKFSTYAVPMISGEIKRFLRDDGMIKVSRNVKELYVKIKYTSANFEAENGRAPSISEISEILGADTEEIIYALNASEIVSSLDESASKDDEKIMLKDKILDERAETEEQIVDKLTMKQMLSCLKQRERQVIIFRYFKEMTQEQIAKILNISQVQVCRIEKKVLKNLRGMYYD